MTPAALALSLGDPAGIGPELIVEAWARRESEGLPPFFAVGGAWLLKEAAKRRRLVVDIEPIASPGETAGAFARALPVLTDLDGAYRPGEPDDLGAGLALASLEEAVSLAITGEAGAVVTGPVAKARLAEAGFSHPGQTEYLAHRCGVSAEDAVMMLAGPQLRTVPLTVHIALAEVPGRLSIALICRRARILAQALARDFGIDRPRIAIAALNPHAGEEGRFGTEEARIIGPAIEALAAEGLAVTGPHPADALFAPHMRETYDAALCMYHDQALVPLKALDFDAGVNVTLGLPIVRTSADHGTAFAIAGTGTARSGATIAAIRMAGQCATLRAAAGA